MDAVAADVGKARPGGGMLLPGEIGFVEGQLRSAGVEKEISALAVGLPVHQDEFIPDKQRDGRGRLGHVICRARMQETNRRQEKQKGVQVLHDT